MAAIYEDRLYFGVDDLFGTRPYTGDLSTVPVRSTATSRYNSVNRSETPLLGMNHF